MDPSDIHWEAESLMFGYAVHIRRLKQEDLERWPDVESALGEYDIPATECVTVIGEDLGECLAAVVHLNRASDHPLVWSDSDGKGTPIKVERAFAEAIAVVLYSIIPDLPVLGH